jgi:acylphosphatase
MVRLTSETQDWLRGGVRQYAVVAVAEENVRLTAWVHGRVQGVGFRWWTRSQALQLGLRGCARNLPDGRVEVVAEGTREACARMLDMLRSGEAPGRVDTVVERWSQPRGDLIGFTER